MRIRWFLPIFIAFCSSPLLASHTLQLCQDDVDVYPWHISGGKGLSNLMLEMVGKQLDLRFEISNMPWKRCLAMVEKNQIDGAIAASFRPERISTGAYPLTSQKQIDTSRRMSDETYVFFVLKTTPQAIRWDGKNLAVPGKPVAAQLGYSAVGLLRGLGAQVDDSDKRPELLLRKLLLEQVSAVVLNEHQGERLLKEPPFADKIIRLEPPLQTREGYLLFSHAFANTHPELAKRIWSTIASVRESGPYQRELQKMLSAD